MLQYLYNYNAMMLYKYTYAIAYWPTLHYCSNICCVYIFSSDPGFKPHCHPQESLIASRSSSRQNYSRNSHCACGAHPSETRHRKASFL